MAEGYFLPPWLKGVSPEAIGTLFEGGARTGASIAEAQAAHQLRGQQLAQQFAYEQANLQRQREQAQLMADVKQKQLEAQTARFSQQIEMERAYHDQTIQVRQDRVNLQAAKQQEASDAAARAMVARQGMQTDLANARTPEERRQAIFKWASVIPGMGTSMAAAVRGEEASKEYGDIQTVDLGGGFRGAYRKGSPGFHVLTPPKGASIAGLGSLAKAAAEAAVTQKSFEVDDPLVRKILKAAEQQIDTQMQSQQPKAFSKFKEGQVLTHEDGSKWVMRGGKPVPFSPAPTAPGAPEGDEEVDESDQEVE